MAAFSLEGRVALVTGAGRGIGRAIAHELAAAGASVALLARDGAALEAVAAEIAPSGARTLALPCDVGDPAAVEAALTRCAAELGPPEILVNNAGQLSRGPIWEIEPAEWERLLRVNLTGAFLLARAAVPAMRERRWGRIINIASISAQSGGLTASVAYSASKGGLLAFTKTLARDLAPYGVTVNAVSPGQIETEMSDALTPEQLRAVLAAIPLGRLGAAREIAAAVRYLASDEGGYISGATLDVNGGILKR